MRVLVLVFFLITASSAFAQVPENGLVAYFSFSSCTQIDTSNLLDADFDTNASLNIIRDNAAQNCVADCGAANNALSLNGSNEQLIFLGSAYNDVFNRSDFAISFYFRPAGGVGKQTLFFKGEECNADARFAIHYLPSSNRVEVTLSQSASINGNVAASLDVNSCWHHVVFVRQDTRSILYINGVERASATASTDVNIDNNGTLIAAAEQGQGPCADRFEGWMDEIAIYERAIQQFDVDDLYFNPEQIVNRDTIIFVGGSVDINLSQTCATSYTWSPDLEINDINIANPTMSPTADITYTVDMESADCTARDQINITVIDPDDLDCNEVFFPKAFTPNGDQLNDVFRINNPYTMDALISFEVLDRWGSRIFITEDPFEGWDGYFDGQIVNPGVFLYRVKFICEGEESSQVGSLTLIR